jgi:hypothetical protein
MVFWHRAIYCVPNAICLVLLNRLARLKSGRRQIGFILKNWRKTIFLIFFHLSKNTFRLISTFQRDVHQWFYAVVATGASVGSITNLLLKSANIQKWGEEDERWNLLIQPFLAFFQQKNPRQKPFIHKNGYFFLEVIKKRLLEYWKEIVANVKNKKAFGETLTDWGEESESEEENNRHPFHDIGCDGNHEVYNC